VPVVYTTVSWNQLCKMGKPASQETHVSDFCCVLRCTFMKQLSWSWTVFPFFEGMCCFLEGQRVSKHPSSQRQVRLNGEAGSCLSKTWIPLVFSLKECQKPPQDFSWRGFLAMLLGLMFSLLSGNVSGLLGLFPVQLFPFFPLHPRSSVSVILLPLFTSNSV
jgi:hypothetical protein